MARSRIISITLMRTILFLSITFLSFYIFAQEGPLVGEYIKPLVDRGAFQIHKGHELALYGSFWPFPFLNKLWEQVVVAFLPSTLETDPITWWQMFGFLCDAGPVYAIWVLESNRAGNRRSAAFLPWVFGQTLQVLGGCIIAPIYYLLHLATAPSASRLTTTTRIIEPRNARKLLLSMLLTYYLPFLGAYLSSSFADRHWYTWIWQMFPIWIGISQSVLFSLSSPVEKSEAKTAGVLVDPHMFWIRVCMSSLTIFSLVARLYTLTQSQYQLWDIFLPKGLVVGGDAISALRNMLQWDYVLFFGSTILWLVFLAEDMDAAGLAHQSGRGKPSGYNGLVTALCLVPLTMVLGPGAAISLAWWLREEQLASGLEILHPESKKVE